jgi:hypothetical protein
MVYLLITLWTIGYVMFSRPEEAWAGLIIILTGCLIYGLSKDRDSKVPKK